MAPCTLLLVNAMQHPRTELIHERSMRVRASNSVSRAGCPRPGVLRAVAGSRRARARARAVRRRSFLVLI